MFMNSELEVSNTKNIYFSKVLKADIKTKICSVELTDHESSQFKLSEKIDVKYSGISFVEDCNSWVVYYNDKGRNVAISENVKLPSVRKGDVLIIEQRN